MVRPLARRLLGCRGIDGRRRPVGTVRARQDGNSGNCDCGQAGHSRETIGARLDRRPEQPKGTDNMEARLNECSKAQLIAAHRELFGNVGDSGRTSKGDYIAKLLTADAARLAEVLARIPSTPAPMPPDAAAQELLRIVQSLAGASVNVEQVRQIADDAVTAALAKQEPQMREVKIVVTPAATVKLEEHTHPVFAEVLQAIGAGLNVLLVGPAGCGKTHLAAQVSKALTREFGTLHCTAGASEAQLVGWLLPVGEANKFEYVPSQFVRLYEKGNSLFLLDELDAADPNMLLVINGALANGSLHVPTRYTAPDVPRGQNAGIIAAANTYGHGADLIYAGRNQLDAATLDRFYVVEMDYDTALEKQLAPAHVLDWAWNLRRKVAELKLRRVVSTRTIQKAAAMLSTGQEWNHVKVRLLAGWTRDELSKVGE